ncbi:hypothetical protein D1872_339360 [compost metagenome]
MITSATSTIRIEPVSTGMNRNDQPVPPSMMASGLAPAGGWVVLVSIMTRIDKPTLAAMTQLLLPNK